MKRTSACTLLPLILVAACGGSGNSVGGNTPPPNEDFGITSSNAKQASKVAYQSVITSGDIADLVGSSGLTGNGGSNFSKPDAGTQLKGAISSLVQNIPFGPTQLPCVVSGSLTISGDLANPLTLTAGDTVIADYDNCDDGVGEIIDGTLDFVVDVFTGDLITGAYALTMTMDLVNFQVATAIDVSTANGDGTATLNSMLAPYVEASASGNSMTTDTNGATETLSAYSSAQTIDAGLDPAPYTMIASGTLDSSQLSGVVAYSTPVMFEGFGNDYPNTGELLIDGGGSSALLVAINNVDVRIEIDSDGDGTVDDTIMTTWAELTSP